MKSSFHVLFVCTGNVFRSMTAEYCLKGYLQQQGEKNIIVHSAGIEAEPEEPRPETLIALQSFGLDASGHRQTKLTQEILDGSDIVIAMALNHQIFIKNNFNREVPLFNEIAMGAKISVPDIGNVVRDAEQHPAEEKRFIIKNVTYIHDHIPAVYRYVKKRYKSS